MSPVEKALHLMFGLMALTAVPDPSASQVGPVPRSGHGGVYHSGLEMVVVFGGRDSAGTDLNDLWGWDGDHWNLLDEGSNGPAPRARHVMAYDPVRNRIIVQGGGSVESDLADTWAWEDGRWSRLGADGPGPRSHHQMAYDTGSEAVVLYGGGRGPEGFGSDMWALEGERWHLLNETLSPGRILSRMIPMEEGILLYGGLIAGGPRSDELWEWREDRWSLANGSGPQGLISAGIAWRTSGDELVLFGGESEAGLFGETWTWGESGWVRREVARSPSSRTEHVLVTDETRGVVVLFGGRSEGGLEDDVWEWNGEEWTRVR